VSLEALHAGSLVDLHAAFEEDPSQAARKERRLNRRRARHEDAVPEGWRGAALLHRLTVHVDQLSGRAEPLQVGD
jgi:hypothetical protein